MSPTPEQYRAHYLDADRAQWRFAIVLFALPVTAFIGFDYEVFGWSSKFFAFAAMRLLQLAYSAWLWAKLARVTEGKRADQWLIIWWLLGILAIFATALGRPTDYYGHYLFEIFTLLFFCAAVPIPPEKQLALMLLYLPITLAILIFYKTPPLVIYNPLLAFFLSLTVGSGYLISRRIDGYRMAAFVAQLALQEQARTDSLTGIANRRAFMDWAAAEVARQDRNHQPLALLMLDIDLFKTVNDKHGHAAGDALLIEFTRRIASALRRYDHFARLGGDEFVIALPNCELAPAQQTAQRIRDIVSREPYSVMNQQIRVTISVGVTRLHGGESIIDGALKRTDAALYAAKQAGRDRVEVVG